MKKFFKRCSHALKYIDAARVVSEFIKINGESNLARVGKFDRIVLWYIVYNKRIRILNPLNEAIRKVNKKENKQNINKDSYKFFINRFNRVD